MKRRNTRPAADCPRGRTESRSARRAAAPRAPRDMQRRSRGARPWRLRRGRCRVGIGAARSMADGSGRLDRSAASRPSERSRRRRGTPAAPRATPRSRRSARRQQCADKSGWHCEPLAWHPSTPYLAESSALASRLQSPHGQPRIPPSSRSRRKCCSRPMPAASFRWRRAPTTRRSIGSSRRCAASSRSTASTCRRGSPARCAPTASPSPSTAISTACSTAAPSRSPAVRAPGSMRASACSIASCTSAAIATASKSTTATIWSAASTASRSAAPSSARACSTARATRPRSRWCIWSRGCEAGGFKLLDTQFVTDHLKTFGAIEVPRRQYHKLLEAALSGEGDFAALGMQASGHRRAGAASSPQSLASKRLESVYHGASRSSVAGGEIASACRS